MFDRVVYINRDCDTARREAFERSLAACDWPDGLPWPQRVPGCDTPAPSWYAPPPRSWGCFLAHEQIYRDCLIHGIESVLIFEDDAVFTPDFAERFGRFMAAVPDDWQQVYLGGHHYMAPRLVNDKVLRCTCCNGAWAYGLRGMGRSAIHELMGRIPQATQIENWHIDVAWGSLHKGGVLKAYCPWQWMVGHAAGQSVRKPEEIWPHVEWFQLAEWFLDSLREQQSCLA